jgi:hypothetical protein
MSSAFSAAQLASRDVRARTAAIFHTWAPALSIGFILYLVLRDLL